MDSTTRQYDVLIYPCSEAGDTPSSAVHMEVIDNFGAFYEQVMSWIREFGQPDNDSAPKFRICDGEREDIDVFCKEEEIILSLLYCCDKLGIVVTVREISYQGNRYTDISDIRISQGSPDKAHDDSFYTYSMRLHAKKNGQDMQMYFFGPYIRDFNDETVQVGRYPMSSGMVEITGNRIYAGAHPAGRCECYAKDGGVPLPVWVQEDVHVFLETDGENVTFSALMDGRLRKKISRDKEKVVFYSVLSHDGAPVSKAGFWYWQDLGHVVFKNIDGVYQLYLKEASGSTFVPPRILDPRSLNQDLAYMLCKDYVNRFYAGSSKASDRGEEGTGEGAQDSRDYGETHDAQDSAAHSEELALWDAFQNVLVDIHDKYSQPGETNVQPAEVLYAASIFFSLEKEELDRFLATEKLWEKYELLKAVAQDILVSIAGKFVFSEMRRAFAYDFSYINSIFSAMPFAEEGNPILGPEGLDGDVREGLIPGYNLILSFVEIAGRTLYYTKSGKYRVAVSSVMDYYQKKAIAAFAEKEIDTVIDLRKYLREKLKAKVKGQDMAVDKFVDGYIRYQLRGKTPGKPAGLYLFAGPPGTGKTYLAEVFAELTAGEGYQYRRFDMASYSGANDTITGLVGFEKGWKSAQPGQLTGFVRNNPRCVLLFDEIEKASPQARHLFLSVLEGAVLTDKYYDEQVSFEEAIVIFTTNEGKDLYEDNRGVNLTAMSDSAVMDGLEASKFAPELISRFMSGTIIMFNHLSYFNMSYIFKASVDAAIGQIRKRNSNFDFSYGDELPKLYLLSKGGNIDARFVSMNAKKMAEDYFLEAMEYVKEQHSGSLKELKEIYVSAEITDELREYFEMTQKPRILVYAGECAAVYTGMPSGRNNRRQAMEYEGKELCRSADCDWADSGKSFKESLRNCNWNSREKKDRYDAVLIHLGGSLESRDIEYDASEGYACLKAAVEENRDIPIIVVDRGNIKQKTPLMALGVTDFVRGGLYRPRCTEGMNPDTAGCEGRERGNLDTAGCKGQESEGLVLDGKELTAILARQHFVEMVAALARKNQRVSGDAVYDYEEESGKLQVRFTNLRVKAATEEDAEARRQNKKYLLADKPQVRLDDIYGNELMKKAVRRCIDNIKNPEKYRESGARLMRGILMYGAPGMGKTMVAKAMSYESGASFISRAGSDFLNGEGIEKMEEVFKTARRKKPCILFIDEFDAISQSRGGRISNYQEIVLEKFLKEMDGLDTDNDGVYVVGATNYSLEDLDEAVIRRFSAKIRFPYPDKEERLDFLLHLLEKKGLLGTISEREVKTLNLMMSGRMRNFGEVKTFIEESIAEAVFEGRPVTKRFLYNRIHNETDGAIRQKKEMSQTELMLVAFHEAGHAVLQYLSGRENEYVTIVSRGDYGGYAMAQPKYHTGQDFLEQICISFAGRAAEMRALELTPSMDSNEGINIGARSDLENATQIAYEYVCRYGLGGRFMVVPEIFKPRNGRYPENVLPEAVLPEAEKEAIWTSVKQILEQQWEYTRQQLQENWRAVRALAISLIYMQALDGEIVKEIIETQIPYVEEGCFLDYDYDYVEVKAGGSIKGKVPYGYPVYPYTEIKKQMDEEDMAGADGRHYFYTVKKGIENLGLYENLQKAFEEAYTNNGASCRRFEREEAAREYLEMLELKAFRQGEERSWYVSVDALAKMQNRSAAVEKVLILKGEEADRFREQADEAEKPFAQYFTEFIETELDENEDFCMVIQIYDEGMKAELLGYLCIKGLDGVISNTSD